MCIQPVFVQLPSHVQLLVSPWTAACQASLSLTIYQNLLKFMSIELVMPSNHLTLCFPILLLPSNFHSIRVFSNELALYIRKKKCWSFNIRPSKEYSGLISFKIDWFYLLAFQGTLKSLFQHQSPKALIIQLLPSLLSSFHIIHDYWRDSSLDYMDLCWQSDIFAF